VHIIDVVGACSMAASSTLFIGGHYLPVPMSWLPGAQSVSTCCRADVAVCGTPTAVVRCSPSRHHDAAGNN
jgi:hypothetical protein